MRRLSRLGRCWAAAARWDVLAGAVGVLVVLAALLAVIVYLPQLAIDPHGLSRTDWLTHVENLRGTILQGLGGLALLGTLYFSARTLRLNRRGQLTERFTKAIEQLGQLGPEKLAVRLGGIYALEQIALDSEELHWPVMEVLTAFLRENSRSVSATWGINAAGEVSNEESTASPELPLSTDLQAIATVLCRRPEPRWRHEERNGYRLDLSGVHLRRARLGGAHLEEANLDQAHLEGAYLPGAHLEWARLTGARLERADLGGAHLEGARLAGGRLGRADLRGAFLQGAFLGGADLTGARLTDARMARAHLRGAKLASADLRDAHMKETFLVGADLREASLEGADLSGAELEGADITRMQLEEARIDDSTVLPAHLAEGAEPADPGRR